MSSACPPARPVLLAIDPGTTHCAAALYQGDTCLGMALLKGVGPRDLAQKLSRFLGGRTVEHLVVEGQQVYPRSPVDPNDLFPLAVLDGVIVGQIPALKVFRPRPREWKGSTKKELKTRQLRAELTEEEVRHLASLKLTKKFEADVLDAVGIAKWARTAHPSILAACEVH